MNRHLSDLIGALKALKDNACAVLVSVDRVQGSTPRDAGAWMAVFDAGEIINTLGGGQLEFQAIDVAKSMLKTMGHASSLTQAFGLEDSVSPVLRFPLGPSLGQCCGGVVHLSFEKVRASDLERLVQTLRRPEPHLALFGAGHVGRALMRVMSTLPWTLSWIDSREDIFLQQEFLSVTMEHSDPVHFAVDHLLSQTHVLIMSFSHAEDLDIVARCLLRQRSRGELSSVGLIGSETKWATFQNRLRERGFTQEELDTVECPIGLPGIEGKEPEVIALSVAARLLQMQSMQSPSL